MLRLLLFASLYILLSTGATAQLTVAKIYSDHAILQRDVEVPVWGTAAPESIIKIELKGEASAISLSVSTGKNGRWKTKLPKLPASGPYSLTINDGLDTTRFSDLMIGDVWLCSGQSNMEWPVSQSNNAEAEIANANDTKIRHFKVPRTWNLLPQDTLAGGTWQKTNPETVGNFTAVGYFFAKNLRKHHDVPIGLLNSSWGGSRIEPWMRAEVLGYESAEQSAAAIKSSMDEAQQNSLKKIKQYLGEDPPTEDRGMKMDKPFWASPNYNHQAWRTMEVPGLWEKQGYEELDGVVWYRKDIYLTSIECAENIQLSLGSIDDNDITYWNGNIVGETNQYNAIRNYTVPKEYLIEGVNVLTVRVNDLGWGGGFSGDCELFFYETQKNKKSLCGEWHANIGQVNLNNTLRPNQVETVLYNQMIHPIIDFPIKGVIWYQGESNASIEGARDYRKEFPDMIKDWRKVWGIGDFPFLWVQLANWQAVEDQPTDTGWARLQEAQSMTLKTPNTAQAVIIDIGETDDIHPRNKQDVGYRLSLGARKLAYAENLVYAGPKYKSMKVENGKIRLEFDLQGSQLMAKDGELQEFAIAGADQKFYWAQAKIDGNSIIVWSEKVTDPVAVRYAWANNPIKANLYNSEGLPASPFRTDDW
jgi:sialate O-acetylesterase